MTSLTVTKKEPVTRTRVPISTAKTHVSYDIVNARTENMNIVSQHLFIGIFPAFQLTIEVKSPRLHHDVRLKKEWSFWRIQIYKKVTLLISRYIYHREYKNVV